MLGIATVACHVSPKEFWKMTPLEYNGAVDIWITMMKAQGLMADDPEEVADELWSPEVIERAKKMLEDD